MNRVTSKDTDEFFNILKIVCTIFGIIGIFTLCIGIPITYVTNKSKLWIPLLVGLLFLLGSFLIYGLSKFFLKKK